MKTTNITLSILLRRVPLNQNLHTQLWLRLFWRVSSHEWKLLIRTMSDQNPLSRKPIYHFIFQAFPVFNTEKLKKTTIDQIIVVYGGSVSCGIMTSHKHLSWGSFWRIKLRMFLYENVLCVDSNHDPYYLFQLPCWCWCRLRSTRIRCYDGLRIYFANYIKFPR